MKRVAGVLVLAYFIIVSLLTLGASVSASADRSLTISRFKIASGSQFVELHNNGTQAIDMSRVQLAYHNNYDLSAATSSKMVSLDGQLDPDHRYLVNDSFLSICYEMFVYSASLDFSTTSGMVQLIYLDQSEPGGPFTSQVLDSIAWTRTASKAEGDVLLNTPSSKPEAFLQQTDSGWTQFEPDPLNPCGYVQTIVTEEEAPNYSLLSSSGSLPPVRYVTVSEGGNTKLVGNRNPGKMSPIINELLPNPASPQTDSGDEFVELFNPNGSTFDLTGFTLAFGSNNPRKYTFPEGTKLAAKQFKAFTSAATSISLSNSEAQVWLLDPAGKVIAQTEPYKNAKDGQAWALDSGRWVWTLQPTKGAMNQIAQALGGGDKAKQAAQALGITTGNSNSGEPAAATGGNTAVGRVDDKTPLHPGILAVVGLAALAYMLYEYRQDVSNKLFQFRRNLQNRQIARSKVPRR